MAARRTALVSKLGASAGVTAMLAAGAVGLAGSGTAVAQQYPPAASPSIGGIGGADPSAPPSTPAGPPSTPAGPPTDRPSAPPSTPACGVPALAQLDRSTIIATGSALLTVTGEPRSTIDVFAYTRPSTDFVLVRTATVGDSGTATFRLLPPANTRIYAQQRGCSAGPSVVLNVRTALSMFAVRDGVRTYTFSGDSLPARRGGLIVSLYRVTPDGRQVLTAQARGDQADGEWTINRRFTGKGRFGFVVRTGQDLTNAPGTSNTRSTLVF